MSKIKPIVRGNIVVWPVIPSPTAGVKLHDQSEHLGHWTNSNVVILPVVYVQRKTISEAQYNDIQKVVAKTMRGQRATKHNPHVIKRLRAMFKYPA